MVNKRFALVFIDSRGRSVRRAMFSRGQLRALAAAAACLSVALLAATVHGVVWRPVAQESEQLRRENRELRALLTQLEAEVPRARLHATRAELTFAQLWAKSGLGVEPRMLGVGPFEADAMTDERAMMSAVNGDIMAIAPIALPLEVERIQLDAPALQRLLGELLEYFHDAERLLRNTPSTRPARTPWLTSSFGKRRDPMTRKWVMHKGMDIGGAVGTEIVAPADGIVIWVGRRGGYGQTVVIDHGFGIQTHFAHLNRYRVAIGERVQRGDVIAEMGSTGKSTGPHLHYEVRRNGQPLDPARFVLD